MSFQPRLQELITPLSDFISTPLVRQITGGIHVNDALIHDAWGALPPEWTAYWAAFPDHRLAQRELIDSIDEDSEDAPDNGSIITTTTTPPNDGAVGPPVPPPQSLTTWLAHLKAISLPRAQRKQASPIPTLPASLTSRMTPKKAHEVAVAAAHIHAVCGGAARITRVVDMGAGQGYLSVALAVLFPWLRVLAIDGSATQVAGSRALAAALGVEEGDDGVTHLVRRIDASDEAAAELLVADMEAWARGEPCMLVGLHACGSLSEHMLRFFQRCPFVTRLGAVGCCYNHIVPRSAAVPGGFPVSERLRERGVTLSATALMTGCQAPNNWERADLSRGSSVHARKHFYRAVLEKLLHDKGLLLRPPPPPAADAVAAAGGCDRPAWGIRKGDLVSFERFAMRALHCLFGAAADSVVSCEEIAAYEARYRGHEGRVAILWTLSVLCCKAVESVVAVDRYCFLAERGFDGVDVVPVFDYRISPRNLMVVARKD